jgi:hypothetical protein
VLFHHGSEPGHGHYEQLALFQRGGICRARSPVDRGELSENGTGVEHVQDDLAARRRADPDLHDALQHDQHLIGVVALPEERLPSAHGTPPACLEERGAVILREPFEEADMGVVHAGGLVQLRLPARRAPSFPVSGPADKWVGIPTASEYGGLVPRDFRP